MSKFPIDQHQRLESCEQDNGVVKLFYKLQWRDTKSNCKKSEK